MGGGVFGGCSAPPKALLFLSLFWVPIHAAGSLARPCVHRPLNIPPGGHKGQWTVLVVTHRPWEPRPKDPTDRGGWGWGPARPGRAFLRLDNTEASQCPVQLPLSVSYVPRALGRLPGRRGSAQLLVWPLVGCVTLTRSLPSLGPEFAPQRRGLPGRPTPLRGKGSAPRVETEAPTDVHSILGGPFAPHALGGGREGGGNDPVTKQATPPHPGLLVQQNWSFLQKPWEPGQRPGSTEAGPP